MFEYQVLPFLQDRRSRVPVERVLVDDDVMLHAELLFSADIDEKVRIAVVQVVNVYAIEPLDGCAQGAIDL